MKTLDLPNTALINELLHENNQILAADELIIDRMVVEEHGHSCLYHLTAHGTGNAALPARMILKTSHSSGIEAGFYKTEIPARTRLPVISCFGVRHDPATLRSTILLEDLSECNANICDWPSPLPAQAARELVEAIAQFHAACWNYPAKGIQAAALPLHLRDEASYEAYITFLERDLGHFLHRMGSDLSISQQRKYHDALTVLAGLWEKFLSERLEEGNLTLLHGNLSPCNILYPIHSGGKIYFVDWGDCQGGLPASDLAVLLGLHLCPDEDEAAPLLSRYHNALVNNGVTGYSFLNLLADYQIALVLELFSPVRQFAQSGVLNHPVIENSLLALDSFESSLF